MNINGIISEITDEIARKRGFIEKSPSLTLASSNRHISELVQMANLYSWWIENPKLVPSAMQQSLTQTGFIRRLRERSREGQEVSKEAWKRTAGYSPLKKHIGHEVLMSVGELMDPNNYQYRDRRRTLLFDDYVAPNHEKIPQLLDETFQEFKNILDPIEAAIYLHLRIAGIQPFFDGNKRTARILQNRLLYEACLPPATVLPGERVHYINVLERGLVGYREENIKEMRIFFTYMASKVNTHLDEILGVTGRN